MMVKSAVERRGFRFFEVPWTAQSKVRGIETMQRLLTERRFAIEKHDRLRHELVTFRQVVNAAGGFTYGARGNGSLTTSSPSPSRDALQIWRATSVLHRTGPGAAPPP